MSLADRVRFAYRCPLAWDKLTRTSGDGVRHCDTCARVVTDLSAMPPATAERYLESRTDAVCVRIEYDASGRAVHRVASTAAIAALTAVAASAVPDLSPATCAPDPAIVVGDAAAGQDRFAMGVVRRDPADLVPTVAITPMGLALDDRPVFGATNGWAAVLDDPHEQANVAARVRAALWRRQRLMRELPQARRPAEHQVLIVVDERAPYGVLSLVRQAAEDEGFDEPRIIERVRTDP